MRKIPGPSLPQVVFTDFQFLAAAVFIYNDVCKHARGAKTSPRPSWRVVQTQWELVSLVPLKGTNTPSREEVDGASGSASSVYSGSLLGGESSGLIFLDGECLITVAIACVGWHCPETI